MAALVDLDNLLVTDGLIDQLMAKVGAKILEAGWTGLDGNPTAESLELWGVPLASAAAANGGKGTQEARLVVAKFLRARDMDVESAAGMLCDCLRWRRDFGVADIESEDFGAAFEGHDHIYGVDLQGRPIVLSCFGTMDVEDVFGDADRFLRWRVQLMERAIKRLQPWKQGSPETLMQIHDYKDCVVIGKDKRISEAVKVFTACMSNNYPEMKGQTVFINFPWIFGALFAALAVFIPDKTKSKFVMLGPTDPSRGELLDFVPPHYLPQRYGGLLADDRAAAEAAAGELVAAERIAMGARSCETRTVDVPAGGSVRFVIRVLAHGVKVTYTANGETYDGSSGEPVGATEGAADAEGACMISAESGVVQREVAVAKGGTVVFTLDNSFSLFTVGKTVVFGAEAC
eukprot:CAMPEP_0182556258 /NCGR_PEP_ID=MMETSP1324-20130603/582_1 /TAXON_ID=236786 /ORGANISM="Florenciella sp., Strain RCC1587" /LENGTH=401 /DNA_ID=CAMNT_0024768119 /DNA_START=80 /DNA_END=1285 /DNA_ORIENTATION=-